GLLHDRSAEVRREAVVALGRLGWRTKEVVSALVALHDRDPDSRPFLLAALARLRPEANGEGEGPPSPPRTEVLPLLRKALADRQARVRSEALALLAALRADGQPLFPEGARLLRDEDAAVARRAALVLFLADPPQDEVLLPALVRMLDEAPRRDLALTLLAAAGPRAKKHTTSVLPLLGAADAGLRLRAASA